MTDTISRGRFAPSPTGPLHIGSLVAALGSYLHARAKNGQWLVRMEDIDPPREQAGAADSILRSLEAHGLHWDRDILYQSTRSEAYESALEKLFEHNLLYYCTCSRREISDSARTGSYGPVYPGTCRNNLAPKTGAAIRIQVTDHRITTHDKIQGDFSQNLEAETGDFILKRRDGLYAYHLAVVVDDAEQEMSEVFRGVDLLDSTPRQQHLQHCLGVNTPEYLHLPVVTNSQGQKLSKQTHAPALDDSMAQHNLIQALNYMNQQPPENLAREPVETILQWATENWDLDAIKRMRAGS